MGLLGPCVLLASCLGVLRIGIGVARRRRVDLAFVVCAVVGWLAAFDHVRNAQVLVVPVAVLAAAGASWPVQALLT